MKKYLLTLTILLTLAGTLLVPAPSVLAAPQSDGFDQYAKSLHDMNGTDGSTTFTDEAGKTWTPNGNAQIDTAQSVYGGASGLFDGTGDYISAAASDDWRLDAGSNSNQWTLDLRVRFNGDPGSASMGLVQEYADTSHWWVLRLASGANLNFYSYSAGSTLVDLSEAWNPAGDTWYHIALVKEGTTGYKFFVDGAELGSAQTDTDPIPAYGGGLRVGRFTNNAGTSYDLNGWVDEFRVSKGTARWTSNFTPPAAEYSAPATIPCQLTDPVTTNDNNQLVTYTGAGWSHGTGIAGYIESDRHVSTTTNDNAQFTFYGTAVTILSAKAADQGEASIYLDNVLDASADLYDASTTMQQSVYCKTNLTLGSHTVKISVKGTKNASSSGYGVNLDAIRYVDSSVLVPPLTNEIQCYTQEDATHVTCSQVDTQHITILAAGEDSHYDPRWELMAGGVGNVYARISAISLNWWTNAFSGSGTLRFVFDVKAEYGTGNYLNGPDVQLAAIGPYIPNQNVTVGIAEFSGQEAVATAGVYHTGTQIQYTNSSNQSGVWGNDVLSWVLELSTTPFADQCISQYMALMTAGPYNINPTIESPLGPTGSPPDEQTYPINPSQMYMIRIGGDPWHNGTSVDQDGASYSWDNVNWYDLKSQPECVSLSDSYYKYSAVVQAPPAVSTIYIRANDTPGAFANNYMDAGEHFIYTISLVILIGQGDCAGQFTFDPVTDLVANVSVPANQPYTTASDALVPGDWYVIEIASGSWQDGGTGDPKYDAQFSFGEVISGNPTGMNRWRNIGDGGYGVYCATMDGNYATAYTQADNSSFLYLRVNDLGGNFTDNTGSLGINIYHASFTRRPAACELTYSVNALIGHSVVKGEAENGLTIGISASINDAAMTGTMRMVPGAWYMLETVDGPWGYLGATHQTLSYDVAVQWGGSWIPLANWEQSPCNVETDALGHRRVYFQTPVTGSAEYKFRVGDTEVWFNNIGNIGLDLYTAYSGDVALPGGGCDYIYDSNQPITPSPITIAATLANGAQVANGQTLTADTLYAFVIEGNDYHWTESSGSEHLYAMQISDDNGTSWHDVPEGYGPVLCYIQNGNQTTMFIKYGYNYNIRFRVKSTTFADNTGDMGINIYPANAGDTIDPWTSCTTGLALHPIAPHTWIDVRAPDGQRLPIVDTYLTDEKVLGFAVEIEYGTGPWLDGETDTQHYNADLSSDNGSTWKPMDKSNTDLICAKMDLLKRYATAYFHITADQIWKIRVGDSGTATFTDNTGNLGYKLYAVTTATTIPDCIVDTNNNNCVDPTIPVFTWPGFGTDLCVSAVIRPTAPTSIDVPQWLNYLADWMGYGVGVGMQYMAWCQRHTDALMALLHVFDNKDPMATMVELDQIWTAIKGEVESHNWSDTSAPTSGLMEAGGGAGPEADSIMSRLFPFSHFGARGGQSADSVVNVWNGGPLISRVAWTGNSDFDACKSDFADLLPNEGLTTGVCFIRAANTLVGGAFVLQIMLELAAIGFLIRDLIGVTKETAAFMAGGSSPQASE